MYRRTIGLCLGILLLAGEAFADLDFSNGSLGALSQTGGTISFIRVIPRMLRVAVT